MSDCGRIFVSLEFLLCTLSALHVRFADTGDGEWMNDHGDSLWVMRCVLLSVNISKAGVESGLLFRAAAQLSEQEAGGPLHGPRRQTIESYDCWTIILAGSSSCKCGQLTYPGAVARCAVQFRSPVSIRLNETVFAGRRKRRVGR